MILDLHQMNLNEFDILTPKRLHFLTAVDSRIVAL